MKEKKDLYNKEYYKQYESGFLNQNRSDHKRIIELCKFKKKDKILDIGCGYGVLLSKIKSDHKYGLESNEYAVKVCKKIGLNVKEYQDIEKVLPFKDDTFDFVIMNEVIEHLSKPSFTLNECSRIIKKRGKIAITTPSKNIFVNKLDPTHFFELSNYDLELLLKASGFKILKHEVCGINFMDWLLRNSVFLIGRLIRKRSIKDNKSSQLVDSAQKKFDNSLLAKLLSRFRSNLLWFGSQQLVIAQKI